MQSYTVEQVIDVPVPQIREKTGEVIPLMSQERISDRVTEQIIEVAEVIPGERLQQHTEKQIADVHTDIQPGVQRRVCKDKGRHSSE